MRRRLAAATAAPLVAGALMIACGDADALSSLAAGGDAGARADGGFGRDGDAGSAVGAASGVVLLHAAAYPAFRLCFENYPELAPQPDSVVMPEANVVGVEIGSAVRLGALERPPGKVYVIDQREVRASPRDPSERKCKALIEDQNFIEDLKYHVAGELTEPLGVGHVDVLAITGCAGEAMLTSLGISPSDCTDWTPTKGSLRARTVQLLPTVAATSQTLPVQLILMSPLLERERQGGRLLDVTFGALGAAGDAAPQPLDVPPLHERGEPTVLDVDQSSEAYFGTHGFRIAVRSEDAGFDAGGPSFAVDQSLAEVQELSSPQTLPTSYYLAASNYALLLLGDPRIARSFPDGGANPGFNPRRAVHLLAVPVKDPGDGGTEPLGDPDASAAADGATR